MWDSTRRVVGCLVLPPSAAVVGLTTYDAFWHAGLLPHGAPIHSLDAAESLGLGLALVALPMMAPALIGVSWLSRTGKLSIRSLLLLAAAVGNLPFALIICGVVLVTVLRGESLVDVAQNWEGGGGAMIRVALGSITGVGSALIYWLVAVVGALDRERP